MTQLFVIECRWPGETFIFGCGHGKRGPRGLTIKAASKLAVAMNKTAKGGQSYTVVEKGEK